jgi:uncharacterized protein (DUF302 family)
MIEQISVDHVTFKTDRSFEEVVAAFEKNVGTIEDIGWGSLAKNSRDYAEFEERVKDRLGKSDFTRFLTVDHGEWVTLQGLPMKSIMYVIGNPLIAITMIKHDFEAGLDVPVRVNIYEHKDGKIRFVYNKPSSLMSALHSSELRDAALKLDAKMMALGEAITGSQA